jgi:hypothetical protein
MSIEDRLRDLALAMQARGFTDVRTQLPTETGPFSDMGGRPVIGIGGWHGGQEWEFTYVADGEPTIEAFFTSAFRSLEKFQPPRSGALVH